MTIAKSIYTVALLHTKIFHDCRQGGGLLWWVVALVFFPFFVAWLERGFPSLFDKLSWEVRGGGIFFGLLFALAVIFYFSFYFILLGIACD